MGIQNGFGKVLYSGQGQGRICIRVRARLHSPCVSLESRSIDHGEKVILIRSAAIIRLRGMVGGLGQSHGRAYMGGGMGHAYMAGAGLGLGWPESF